MGKDFRQERERLASLWFGSSLRDPGKLPNRGTSGRRRWLSVHPRHWRAAVRSPPERPEPRRRWPVPAEAQPTAPRHPWPLYVAEGPPIPSARSCRCAGSFPCGPGRRAALAQREGRIDHRLDLAGRDQRPDLLLDAARDRGLFGDGARAAASSRCACRRFAIRRAKFAVAFGPAVNDTCAMTPSSAAAS